ncbi:hypothetical protein FIBSPDRAFT_165645 [Athelia psychrophila]|uniref:Uncharacterized protein n=1 Tax=Athelia psychrophila TaxID=1759441 RepID=A0A166B406_9AGAM|nr:hypothetical protein FIBSPDRAFT_165645 [Fibularhizoctonia sp. CBS 109695]
MSSPAGCMSINDSNLSLHCILPSLPIRFWPDAPDENGTSTPLPIYPLLQREIMPESQHISESRYMGRRKRAKLPNRMGIHTPEHASPLVSHLFTRLSLSFRWHDCNSASRAHMSDLSLGITSTLSQHCGMKYFCRFIPHPLMASS